jgi:tRNA threonylcarbamoyl adenosine modification protein (Sua5/YciO/YrdC/YwlC family)
MTTATFDCGGDDRPDGLSAAAAAIRQGQLVVLPTDTVYGVAADAFNPAAVNLLLAAKGRGRDMPVPVLVASRSMVDAVVDQMPDVGRALAEAFWPGALTLVVRHTAHLAWDLGESRGTVAVRMPDHPLAVELIEQTGPLAVSSANRSGNPAATTALDAQLQLGASVRVYLDGGPTPEVAEPSTIVDITDTTPRLLRLGAIGEDRLIEVVPDLQRRAEGGSGG